MPLYHLLVLTFRTNEKGLFGIYENRKRRQGHGLQKCAHNIQNGFSEMSRP